MTENRYSSIADLRRRVELEPSNPVNWFNLSVLYQNEGNYKAQQACIVQAEHYGFQGPELFGAKASLLLQEGKVSECIALNQQLLKRYPDYLPAYESIARLSWQHSIGTDPLLECRNATQQQINNIGLQKTYLRLLSETESWQSVLDHIAYLRSRTTLPPALPQEAVACEHLGLHGKANELYKLCVQLDPEDAAVSAAYAACLLREGLYQSAVEQLQKSLRLEPDFQLAWAYLGLAWRLLGDEREYWLHDYDHLVMSFDIPRPSGYASQKDFLQQLKQGLYVRHTASREPMQQTLRGGTQTQGNLFAGATGVIKDARDQIAEAVSDYCQSLPADRQHPFLSRNTSSFCFSGAWSALLRSGGFHTNHVHDQGWSSSAFYVELPLLHDSAEDNHEGWLQLGQPPQDMGLDLPPRRTIQPKAGHLILFPSYTWHGTLPFLSHGERMTMAFDLFPA